MQWQEFTNYEALRSTVERQELALGADYIVFFDKFAKLDVRFRAFALFMVSVWFVA